MMRVSLAIVQHLGEVSYFRLTKLAYLVDFWSLRSLGRQLTGEVFLRKADGPWSPALPQATRDMSGHELAVRRLNGITTVFQLGEQHRFEPELSSEEAGAVAEVVRKYGHL
ncbi:MAG: Panacea domain-containing protein, partial [Bacillota bacterium]|nr:Panacea domain-containing protein [Bacillota bacterium]